MLSRIVLATIAGVATFMIASSIGFTAACEWSSVAACTGSGLDWLSLWVEAKIGASVLVAGCATTYLAHKAKWRRPWHLVVVFFGYSILVPRVYAWHFQIPKPISLFDCVYPLAGVCMGVVLLGIRRKRSNKSFKPNPLRGSA